MDNPSLKLKFDLSQAGKWDSETLENGKFHHDYQWNEEQWQHIIMSAMRMLVATMQGTAPWATWEEAIPPEAIDYFEPDCPEGLFDNTDDMDINEYINGTATAIGVVDAMLKQLEDEIAKRGGSLP